MQTAHLDRVLYGKNARDVLEDDRWPSNHITTSITQKAGGNNAKQTATIRSIMANDNGIKICAHFSLFLINMFSNFSFAYQN